MFWRLPVKRTHREIVIGSFPYGKLLFEIFKGIESVRSVKLFIVFAVTAFHLAIMPGSIWANELMPDAKLF